MSEELFSVYYESCEALGSILERECYLVPLKEAIRWYRHHTTNVPANCGLTHRVFITDAMDVIVAEWIDGQITWPKSDG